MWKYLSTKYHALNKKGVHADFNPEFGLKLDFQIAGIWLYLHP